MRTFVRLEKPTFYVDEEKKVVVCTIYAECTKNEIWAFCDKKDYDCYGAFTGKARCCADDEWDVKKGMHLAESRCKEKIYRHFTRVYNQYMNWLLDYASKMNESTKKLARLLITEMQHVNDLKDEQ